MDLNWIPRKSCTTALRGPDWLPADQIARRYALCMEHQGSLTSGNFALLNLTSSCYLTASNNLEAIPPLSYSAFIGVNGELIKTEYPARRSPMSRVLQLAGCCLLTTSKGGLLWMPSLACNTKPIKREHAKIQMIRAATPNLGMVTRARRAKT